MEVVAAVEPLKIELAPGEQVAPSPGGVEGEAGTAYLISSRINNGFIAVNRILKAGGNVIRPAREFTAGGRSYGAGTWIVRSPGSISMDSMAKELFLKIQGVANIGAAEGQRMRTPRIGLYQSWVPSMDEVWTRWLFEQYEFPYVLLHDVDVKAGELGSRFDVLVIPDQSTSAIVDGHKPGTIPPGYAGGIGADGVANIRSFVERGGTLLLLNRASTFAADRLGIPVVDALTDAGASSSPQELTQVDYRTRVGTNGGRIVSDEPGTSRSSTSPTGSSVRQSFTPGLFLWASALRTVCWAGFR